MSTQKKLNILLCGAELFARVSETKTCMKMLEKCGELCDRLTKGSEEWFEYNFEILRVAQVSMDNMATSD